MRRTRRIWRPNSLMLQRSVSMDYLYLSANPLPPIPIGEENVIRYISGYVIIRLIKKYTKTTHNPQLQKKWELFLLVLRKMKAEEQLCSGNSLDDYTRMWSDQIDRGGLYHVKPEVSSQYFCGHL